MAGLLEASICKFVERHAHGFDPWTATASLSQCITITQSDLS